MNKLVMPQGSQTVTLSAAGVKGVVPGIIDGTVRLVLADANDVTVDMTCEPADSIDTKYTADGHYNNVVWVPAVAGTQEGPKIVDVTGPCTAIRVTAVGAAATVHVMRG